MSSNLMKTLYQMQQNQDGTDSCFEFVEEVEDEMKKKEVRVIHAHKLILSAASPVFKAMFSEKWMKNENIKIKDANYSTFDVLIKAIYTGCLEVEHMREYLEVYSLAHLYQVKDVLQLTTNLMGKLCNYSIEAVIPCLNYAILYENSELKEMCLKKVKEESVKILTAETFLKASVETVKTIFALDPLNIKTDVKLMKAMERYLEAHPDCREKLEDAIHSIRFLTIDDEKIMECQFLDNDTKDRLLILKNNLDLPINVLTKFSKNRNQRGDHKILTTLPSNVVIKLYELFNDRYCFVCKQAHSSLSCSIVWMIFPPFTYLNRLYSNNYSHTCLERYTNDHVTSILQAFRKLAVDERNSARFCDFLDV